ncbi:hypothetical protein GTW69_13395, partial [Streptomyces sp. SID7760]|nr:hypothetical protein [Streptomyces sp. SID7760]
MRVRRLRAGEPRDARRPDGTTLSVAQPSLRHDLEARVAPVRWTSTAYLP